MDNSPSTDRLQDATVYDTDGNEVGPVAQVYFDEESSEPTFVTVLTGRSDAQETFIPLSMATEAENGLQVPFQKDVITDAPSIAADGILTPEEEERLHDYYDLDYVQADDEGADSDAVVVRNEELDVHTERRAAGQVRLRKRTTTRTETVEVPVTREEIVIEREPVDPDSAEARDADAGQDEVVVDIQEEVPVVRKNVTAEKVSVDKATVQDTETVSDTVRHDDIQVDRDASQDRRG